MKAWNCPQYGGPDILQLVELPKPEPTAYEICVRIMATSVASGDRRIRALDFPKGLGLLGRLAFGWNRPRSPILGTEFAGVVDMVGSEVRNYAVGDRLFGFPGGKLGCHAEYRCIKADGPVAPIPENLSYAEAAGLCFGGSTALDFLAKAKLQAGEHILIIGASGSVGSAMVQLAKFRGASVTAVTSAANAELVRSLGADAVLDYRTQDFTKSAGRFDVIADTIGSTSFNSCRRLMPKGGRFMALNGSIGDMLFAPFAGLLTGRSMIAGPARELPGYVLEIAGLASLGHYQPVIDSIFSFENLPDAHARADTGRKRGNVIVELAPD